MRRRERKLADELKKKDSEMDEMCSVLQKMAEKYGQQGISMLREAGLSEEKIRSIMNFNAEHSADQ